MSQRHDAVWWLSLACGASPRSRSHEGLENIGYRSPPSYMIPSLPRTKLVGATEARKCRPAVIDNESRSLAIIRAWPIALKPGGHRIAADTSYILFCLVVLPTWLCCLFGESNVGLVFVFQIMVFASDGPCICLSLAVLGTNCVQEMSRAKM